MNNAKTEKTSVARRNKHELDIATKYHIIMKIESGVSRDAIRQEYGFKHRSNVHYILKMKDKIISKYLSSKLNDSKKVKRMRDSKFPDIEEALMIWITQMKQKRVSLSSDAILKKAHKFALLLGHDQFKGSYSFLNGVKKRCDLTNYEHYDHLNDNCKIISHSDAQLYITQLKRFFKAIGDESSYGYLSLIQNKFIDYTFGNI